MKCTVCGEEFQDLESLEDHLEDHLIGYTYDITTFQYYREVLREDSQLPQPTLGGLPLIQKEEDR